MKVVFLIKEEWVVKSLRKRMETLQPGADIVFTTEIMDAQHELAEGPGLLVTGYRMKDPKFVGTDVIVALKTVNPQVFTVLYTAYPISAVERNVCDVFVEKGPKEQPLVMIEFMRRVSQGEDPRALEDDFPTFLYHRSLNYWRA